MSMHARSALPQTAVLVVLGLCSLAGYALLLTLEVTSRPADVHRFLVLIGSLFLLYAGALWWVLQVFPRLDPAPSVSESASGAGSISGSSALRTVIGFAVAFRLVVLFVGLEPSAWSDLPTRLAADLEGRTPAYQPFLLYDNDAWRYLWDGRVMLAGLDPWSASPVEFEAAMDAGEPRAEWLFAGPPDDPTSSAIGWQLYDRLSFRDYRGIYPPLALLSFAAVQLPFPGSLFAWKLFVLALDISTVFLLAGCAARWRLGILPVLVYGWNPLAVKELVGSGHVDALMITLIAFALWLHARGRLRFALAVLSLSVLAKISSILLVPWMMARSRWRSWWALFAGALVLLPFVTRLESWVESFAVFQRQWAFNASLWSVMVWMADKAGSVSPETWASSVAFGLTILVAGWVAWRAPRGATGADQRAWLRSGLLVLAVPLLFGSTVMPWYVLWLLPLAALGDVRSPWVWTATAFVSYLVYAEQAERTWWLGLEYGLFGLALLVEFARRPELRRDLAPLFSRHRVGSRLNPVSRPDEVAPNAKGAEESA